MDIATIREGSLEGSDPVALLEELGFGGYEAKAYVTLLEQGPLTGYQLAKASGDRKSVV